MRSAPRAALDTNVVLSALLFSRGRLSRLRVAWQQATFHPIVSRDTTQEFVRVLAYPRFKLTADDQRELLADYLPYCMPVAMPAVPPRTPACRDPFAVPLLQLAMVGKAAFVVTGHGDLLSVNGRIRCPIITADAFLRSF